MGDQQRVAQQGLGVHLGERRAPLQHALDGLSRVDVRDHAEHRDLEVRLDVLDGADRGVEGLAHEREHQADEQPQQPADHDGMRRLAADRGFRLGGRPDDRDLLDLLGLLDQRLLVLRLQEREQLVVGLGLALQPLERQLDGGQLAVLLLELADLPVQQLLAVAKHRDLRRDFPPHLQADLAHPVVEGLEARMALGHLEGQAVALEQELGIGGLQLLHRRVGGVDEDALGGVGRIHA